MFASERVRLRPAVPDDADVLYEMWSDPEHHLLTDDSPMLVESLAVKRARLEKSLAEPDLGNTRFTAETIADGTVIGSCSLWGLDAFNQFAHIGISVLPAARTQGYGREMMRLLCHYGFRFRNLHRIELETLARNAAMRKLAESCGFTLEGIQREQAYDGDGFSDIALYGLLRQEWTQALRALRRVEAGGELPAGADSHWSCASSARSPRRSQRDQQPLTLLWAFGRARPPTK